MMETLVCPYPFVIFFFDTLLGLVLYCLLTPSSIILLCFLCCKDTELGKWIINCTETVVEHVFGKVLRRHYNKSGRRIYIVLNYKAPKAVYTTILSTLLIQMVAVAAVQFCDDFFIEESHGCSTRGLICCYNIDLWSGQYINCSNNNNNYSEITCYRFVSKLGNATGSALGVVTTTALIVYLITIVLLKVSNGKGGSNCRKYCTIIIQISVAFLTAILTGLFCWLKFASYYSHTKQINAISEILPTGIIILVYIIFFPWYKCEAVELDNNGGKGKNNEDNNGGKGKNKEDKTSGKIINEYEIPHVDNNGGDEEILLADNNGEDEEIPLADNNGGYEEIPLFDNNGENETVM